MFRNKMIKFEAEPENKSKKTKKKSVETEGKSDKYGFVLKFADTWFDLLENMGKTHNVEDFIKEITGYTLVGENVGDPESQHIQYYDHKDIIFFSMVNNNSLDICQNFEFTYKIFNKYGLTNCPYTKIGPINNVNSFYKTMREVYLNVLKSPCEKEGEGSVVYFSSVDENNNEKIISMSKLKTLEYRIFRKTREKLKGIFKDKDENKSKFNFLNKILKK